MGKTRRKADWEAEMHSEKSRHAFIWFEKYLKPLTKAEQSDKYLHRDGVGKGGGWEFWSRRPMNGCGPGRSAKKLCLGIERARAKRDLRKELDAASEPKET